MLFHHLFVKTKLGTTIWSINAIKLIRGFDTYHNQHHTKTMLMLSLQIGSPSFHILFAYSIQHFMDIHWKGVKEYLNFLNSTQDHSFLHTIYKYTCTRRPEYFKGIFNFKELQVKVLSYILYRSACYTCYRWNDDFKHGNLNFRCNIFVEYTIFRIFVLGLFWYVYDLSNAFNKQK